MIKLHIITTILLFLSAAASAQAVSYSYDASGNRTERARTIVLHSPLQMESALVAADSLTSMADSIGAMHFAVKARYQDESIAVDMDNAANAESLIYTLYNTSGQRLATVNGELSVRFDLSAYPKGIYMIVISDGKGQTTWKVIKE